ncbi:hypothetical protein DTL21_05395 [Bremerella cremea]|uniref:Uncharacterized protein n=1 Tax=Blastopirellula marina TaxID=124 RepID=A0A2S8FYV1_9BACT|nr:hypothetical protein C5Y83_05395 [Blastopirellula marina]RCS49766.1 hypothetical protein DTL21_05395 [Bremerella cremea]
MPGAYEIAAVGNNGLTRLARYRFEGSRRRKSEARLGVCFWKYWLISKKFPQLERHKKMKAPTVHGRLRLLRLNEQRGSVTVQPKVIHRIANFPTMQIRELPLIANFIAISNGQFAL